VPTPPTPALPDPALVVLAGAAGSGKSTWAAARYRTVEIVSSDALRGIVGSGPADLDASGDAFELLDRIVAARAGRGLTTVVDTLGLDDARRAAQLRLARAAGLAAVLVVLDTPAALCRERNRGRDRPVPAAVLTGQLRRVRGLAATAAGEGWDRVVVVGGDAVSGTASVSGVAGVSEVAGVAAPASSASRGRELRISSGRDANPVRVTLQLSRFPWGDDPARWLRDVALAADAAGFDGLALMDHLVQIPQVGRAWEPIPEPYVTLGMLAGLPTGLRLGTLVSPVSMRAPGLVAKAVATLDVLSGGRAFCGLGAGWWAREHAAYGLTLPPARERLDRLAAGVETLRALWAPGTGPYAGRYVELPETTCYPRPTRPVPVIVGGAGDRTLRIAAELADGANVPADDALPRRIDLLRRACAAAGRDPAEVEMTVLDVAVIGTDRDDTAARVERLRGRTRAATFAARHHAGTPAQHADRYRDLAGAGVGAVFLAVPDLRDAADLERCAPLLAALR
jgi:alkanesulfonate monooxygenase SsuD/methylene tetrahydromethanopterin reductase-like flavin-dependent oxidoreductase (luciferase family)/predicted kinase